MDADRRWSAVAARPEGWHRSSPGGAQSAPHEQRHPCLREHLLRTPPASARHVQHRAPPRSREAGERLQGEEPDGRRRAYPTGRLLRGGLVALVEAVRTDRGRTRPLRDEARRVPAEALRDRGWGDNPVRASRPGQELPRAPHGAEHQSGSVYLLAQSEAAGALRPPRTVVGGGGSPADARE